MNQETLEQHQQWKGGTRSQVKPCWKIVPHGIGSIFAARQPLRRQIITGLRLNQGNHFICALNTAVILLLTRVEEMKTRVKKQGNQKEEILKNTTCDRTEQRKRKQLRKKKK